MSINRFTAVTAALLLTLAAIASTNAAPSAADKAQMRADRAAVRNFKLTPEFIHHREAYMRAAARDVCKYDLLSVLHESQQAKSIDQMAANFDAKPGVHALLKRNGLTAREMMLGTYTLVAAAVQDMAKKHPEMLQGNNSGFKVSPANMAVYHQYKDEIHRQAQKLGQEEMKRNGGKMPGCLTEG